MKQEAKSPLRAPPLRVAGESIDVQLSELGYDDVFSPLLPGRPESCCTLE
jgi:hypothetical protein